MSLNDSGMSGYMVSYDTSSLYTNIPVAEAINILCEKIFDQTYVYHGFKRNIFSKFINLAVSNTYFLFNKCLFRRLDGLAMGYPLAPALANVFLCIVEEKVFRTCPDNIKPKFYKRYLDDTFAVFGNEHQAISFYNFINFVHNNIKFTAEHQSNNQLQFLDLNIFNVDDSFTSKVCRKPTFSGLCLSFYSYCPILYK